ncbi:MAG: DNA polymerase III subunit alpha [Candidatus Dadabacteria bacterium]|nr:MAG: DNA polymerase III subunit alpha [Candidatus Dadabacteria bacterium]
MEKMASIFGNGRLFLEVQPHTIPEQQKLNAACFDFAKDMGLPVVATTDCHYAKEEDHYAQEVLMCISTGKQITDTDRIKHDGIKLHLMTGEEVLAGLGEFSGAEEAIDNSVMIAEMCNIEFDFSKHYMPRFAMENGESLESVLRKKAREGLELRFAEIRERGEEFSAALEQEYRDRLENELDLIEKMGFPGYFLVVADFIVWAKSQGIPVGPGRGSCAGSLVAYSLRITEIDPVKNKLIFERFLNPERVSLPDIDVDFCINGRDKVIQYVIEKYGKDRVAQIVTFGTLKAKAAIKDVGRVLGISYAETDRIAQLVPAPRQGFDFSLEESLRMEKRLADYAKNEGKELISLALKLEGLTRHTSTHAAGVVIGDRPLVELLPIMVDKDGNDVTQYSMSYVEKLGFVKFDFLGLKTLTVIHTALDIIKDTHGVEINLEKIPLDDPKTYDLLCAGNTTGVFQLESSGITEVTKRLKPTCFDDITAILALYRPGPLDAGMVDKYIARKHGDEPVRYLHPLMKDILEDTYGIIVYQEQIMQLAKVLAGYSLGQADLLRRAMGKKKPEEMARQRKFFIEGALKNGISKRLAEEIFSQMETFARYGFNRSHSAAYAMISYQTAYLKAHYKVEFMAALMSHEMGDSDKTLKNLNECRKQGIKVLPPDINQSRAGFSVKDGMIRFGLSAIKGIGDKAVQKIRESVREGGDFRDIEDFLMRVDPHVANKRVLEGLIKCGAFDFMGVSRAELISRLDELLKAAQRYHKEKDSNQIGLFGGDGEDRSIPRRRLNMPEWPVNQKLKFEKEALGFYISGHPLEKYSKELGRIGVKTTQELKAYGNGTSVRVGGVITALKYRNTRKGDRYVTFLLEDWLGTVETVVWPDVYLSVVEIIAGDDPVVVSGKLDVGDERRVLVADKVESLIEIRDKNARMGVIEVTQSECMEEKIIKLRDLLSKHKGNCPIKIKVRDLSVTALLRDSKSAPICIEPSEDVCDSVERLFGRPVLTFV